MHNIKDTPETNALWELLLPKTWQESYCVMRSHANKLERENSKLRGATARLCRAVSRRMMPDEPTPEDRMELREAFDAASEFLSENVKAQPPATGASTDTHTNHQTT